MFRPAAQQFATSIRVQHRVVYEVNGMPVVSYQDADPALDFCNWKVKGGTQTDGFVFTDTAEVTMWYRPDVSESDRVLLNEDPDKAYVVVNVENIEQRNMWLLLKVKRAAMQWLQTAQILPCTGYGRHAPLYGTPFTTPCRIEAKTTADEAKGIFPLGTAIKSDDRVSCEGKTYIVDFVSEERATEDAHVEVNLRGL